MQLLNSSLKGNGNLLAHYVFNSGALTTDSSGNSRTLTNNNTVGEIASGKYGYAADFGNPNTNKYFSRAEDIWAGDASSVALWWYPLSTDKQEIWYFDEATEKKQLYCYYDSGILYFQQYRVGVDYDTVSASVTVNTNRWYHVASTFAGDGGAMKLYLDGVEVASGTATAGNGTIAQNDLMEIGRGPSSSEVEGYLDDVAFFSDVLTAAEVKELSSEGGIFI